MNEQELVTHRILQTFEAMKFGPSIAEGAWHGPSLLESLEGVDSGQANFRIIEGRHSIWEIVKHITFWMEAVIRSLKGEEMRELKPTENWPETGITEEDWTEDLEKLRKTHGELHSYIMSLDESILENTVGAYFGEHYVSFTFRKMLHGIADHNTYHAGQISILKKK
jgi:uncharacterized damage-inducible protein DinB